MSISCLIEDVLFSAEYKPRGYYLEHFWQADLGYIGQAIIGVKVPNSSHVACIQHGRVDQDVDGRVRHWKVCRYCFLNLFCGVIQKGYPSSKRQSVILSF